jgi:hypothetical protein
VGNSEECILLHHHTITHDKKLDKCIDENCFWSTALPQTQSCCIRKNVCFLCEFRKIGDLKRLPLQKTNRKIKKLTEFGKSINNLSPIPAQTLINDLSTHNLQKIIPLNSNSDDYFNGINTLGGNLIVKPDMIAYTDGSMIIDGKINYSSASAVFLNKGSPTKLSIALQHDRPSSYRADLWGVILACVSVPNNSNLLVFLDGQGVVNSYCSRLDLRAVT